MAFLSSLDISGSALTANRLWMDVISENIANADTTKTESGGPYRRKTVVLSSDEGSSSFSSILNDTMRASSDQTPGVAVKEIAEDNSAFRSVYDPTNADADQNGYVQMPNVDITQETLDMMTATRAYQASLTCFNAVKSMANKALEAGV